MPCLLQTASTHNLEDGLVENGHSRANGKEAKRKMRERDEIDELLGLQVHPEDLDLMDEDEDDMVIESDAESDDDLHPLPAAGVDARAAHTNGYVAPSSSSATAAKAPRTSFDLAGDPDFARLDAGKVKAVPVAAVEADQTRERQRTKGIDVGGGFEEVPAGPAVSVPVREGLDAEGLALATEMFVRGKKREYIEAAYNRFATDDGDALPVWFADEDRKHRELQLPPTKEMIEEIRQRQRELNERPIKAVLEAKARKKRRLTKVMNKVSAAASSIVDNESLSGK